MGNRNLLIQGWNSHVVSGSVVQYNNLFLQIYWLIKFIVVNVFLSVRLILAISKDVPIPE